MMSPLLIPGVVVGLVVALGVVIKLCTVKTVRVTAADIPGVLTAVSSSAQTPTFAVLILTTPDQPNAEDAVNLQFSLENGRSGFDWVLVSRRNIKDKQSFVDYLQQRGYAYSERKMRGVTYLRVEDGDLAQLCSDVVTKLYRYPPDAPIELIAQGFKWTS